MDYSLLGSSVHGILQARILEWVAISFSRGSLRPRNRTWVSCIAGRFFIYWAVREALQSSLIPSNFGDDRIIFCSNEVMVSRLLDRGWSSKRSSYDWKLGGFSPYSALPQGRGEWLKTELMIEHAYMMRRPQNSQSVWFGGAFRLVKAFMCWGVCDGIRVMCSNSMETDSPVFRTILDLVLCISLPGCSSITL